MGIANTTEDNILKLIFQAVAWALVADNAGTTPLANIAYALHTADPTDTGTQATSETAYTSYARKDVARTPGGHPVSGGSCSPGANVDFIAGTGGGDTVGWFSVGEVNTGATTILFSGTVAPTIATGDGVTPRLTTATTITLD